MLIDEPENPAEKGIFRNNPLSIFICASLIAISSMIAIVIGGDLDSTTFYENQSIYSLSIAQFLSVIVLMIFPALLLTHLFTEKRWRFLGLTKPPTLKNLAFVIGLIVSSNFFLNYLMDLNALIPLPKNLETKFTTMQETTMQLQGFFLDFQNIPEMLVVLFIMAILPAFSEELFFRGVIQGSLFKMKIKAIHAILISSILFAMMHFQFYYLIPLMFMGAVMGYIYYRTKNLWLSIAAHLFNNGLIVIFTGLNKATITQIDLESSPSWYISIVGLIVFILLIYTFRKNTKVELAQKTKGFNE